MEMLGEGGGKKCVNINVIGFILLEYCEVSEVKWIKYQNDEMKNIYYI